MSDLTNFLAERRIAILAAVRRVFYGSTEPIPEVTPRPGIYAPIPVVPVTPVDRDHHAYRIIPSAMPKPPRASQASKKLHKIVPVGTIVKTFFGPGVVLAYIDKGEDPMVHVPPETPAWQLSGGVAKHPACIRRYLIQTTREDHPWFLFSKAAIIEKQVELDCYGDEI